MTDESGHATERQKYIDVPYATDTDTQTLDIECGPLHVNMASAATGGVSITQDGTSLMLVQGMHRQDGTKATLGNGLTPDQARDLATELTAAADRAESPSVNSESESQQSNQSLVDKAAEALFK